MPYNFVFWLKSRRKEKTLNKFHNLLFHVQRTNLDPINFIENRKILLYFASFKTSICIKTKEDNSYLNTDTGQKSHRNFAVRKVFTKLTFKLSWWSYFIYSTFSHPLWTHITDKQVKIVSEKQQQQPQTYYT